MVITKEQEYLPIRKIVSQGDTAIVKISLTKVLADPFTKTFS
jgi:hypothetical protein